MCGIIGEIQRINQIYVSQFDGLRDKMFHRGPDGADTVVLNNGSIAFGHRRLSIIDLSDNAKQPMCNEDGSVWITFNGEIYNFQELRKELIVNHLFKSNSDTEVLIHGYEQWGIDGLLKRLKGMFAFGIWDQNSNSVIVARDRFGIKPLVYSMNDTRFIFASELKSIANHKDFNKEIDFNSLADYFTYSYIPYPNTIWTESKKLPPACYGILDLESFSFKLSEYWHLELSDNIISDADAIMESNRLIKQATEQHLISDVPIGLFLSGGYDSSTLLLNMLDLGYTPDVYTIAFPGHENNEVEQAKAVAKQFGVKHYIEEISNKADVFELLEQLAPYYDEPFAGNSMINNHLIAKLAAKGLKVAFSGEGADEVLGGYKWYRKIESFYHQPKVRRIAKRFVAGELSNKAEFLNLYNRSMLGVFNEVNSRKILSETVLARMRLRKFWHFEEFCIDNNDKVKLAQYLDFKTFIPNHCLQRADISSMANSLEVRVPFLDHEIYEFVFSLNRSVYMKPNVKKFLLHEQIRTRIPQEVLSMPKKGFSFHYSGSNFEKKFNATMANGELSKLGILKEDNFNEISDQLKFHLLNLELWFQNHA